MDNLKASAVAFNALLNTEYHIKAGRKGNQIIELDIDFKKTDFFHLVGLQKLKDIDALVAADVSKKDIFDKIINGEITYEQLSKSVSFEEAKGRIDNFARIETLLDSGNLVFRFYKNKIPGSSIKADYVFYFDQAEPKIYFFIIQRNETDAYKFAGCSFFPSESNNYILKQTKYKLIYAVKKDILNETEKVLIDKIKNHQTK